MSVSNSTTNISGNGLQRIAALSSVVLGFFFLVGALGHMKATWPLVIRDNNSDNLTLASQGHVLLLPALILLITGLCNFCVCWLLWIGRHRAKQFALLVNLLAIFYLSYLLYRGVPDHPIASFLALASSQVILLGAIMLGLTWPAIKSDSS